MTHRRHRDDDCDDERVSKIVEKTWYFDDDCERGPDHDRECDCEPDHGRKPCPPRRPGRPTRPQGTSTGRLDQGGPITKGDLDQPDVPGVWVGTRAEMDLPYLFMRANPADLGARPVVGPFWESPDIFLLGGVDPGLAPPLPPALGDTAVAGEPNTIYAHVWNFGKASANEVLVEFYWCNPALGINAGSVTLIAQTEMSLGAKGSGRSHAVIKCPEAWVPTFVNGGHECLLVRVWDNPADLPGLPIFDASINRHVAQRNIHVVPAPEVLGHGMGGTQPALHQPVLLQVGPLYGAPATVAVERVAPSAVPWLQLRTGQRGVFPAMAPPTGVPALSPPTTLGGGFPTAGGAAAQVVEGDDQHVAFTTTDDAPGAGEAHVYRVSATQDGAVFGGYTIVIMG
ncbi:MAG TPA: hypothetical protein VFA30_04160 [Gaiellaceae bacterium]|nr:hypothetical protein [Gaiellaceae bacterium]